MKKKKEQWLEVVQCTRQWILSSCRCGCNPCCRITGFSLFAGASAGCATALVGWRLAPFEVQDCPGGCRSVATLIAGPGSVVDVQQRVGSTLWRLPAGGGKCSRVTELVLLSSVSCCCLPANSITDVSHPSANVWLPHRDRRQRHLALFSSNCFISRNRRGCESFLNCSTEFGSREMSNLSYVLKRKKFEHQYWCKKC